MRLSLPLSARTRLSLLCAYACAFVPALRVRVCALRVSLLYACAFVPALRVRVCPCSTRARLSLLYAYAFVSALRVRVCPYSARTRLSLLYAYAFVPLPCAYAVVPCLARTP